ncbi:MAG: NAD(P)/FAD-dependent oxidoreductase [Clostridia bacterium]|nr:NAD(P)/FAD-dependent oxidoreductase [Clostridia bacterium]
MYDCIIIGTGVAGVSAALTLKALKRSFIILGDKSLSLKVRSAENIKNYPALPDVSGEQLTAALKDQLKGEEIEITQAKANGVYPSEGGYNVMCGQQVYEAKTVILATGVETVKPVKGELEFLGRGVSYCAVCDGFLYKGKSVAVIAESEEELHDVELLSKYAQTIYLFAARKGLQVNAENVKNMSGRVTEIAGDMRVREVVTADGEKLAVDGVFVLKQSVGAGSLVHGLETQNGIVTVDRACATNLAGVFAAGDITGRPYQYAKAAGEGNVCAYSVNAYLNAAK